MSAWDLGWLRGWLAGWLPAGTERRVRAVLSLARPVACSVTTAARLTVSIVTTAAPRAAARAVRPLVAELRLARPVAASLGVGAAIATSITTEGLP